MARVAWPVTQGISASTPPRTSPRSALAELGSTPRFVLLMATFTLSAISVGAREATRVGIIEEAFGSEFGIGAVAVTFALTLGVSCVVAGRIVDTHDPRPYLVGSLVASVVLTAASGFILGQGPTPVGWLISSSALEAMIFGVATTSLIKVQASVVTPSTRGAAETVSILRSGVGAIAGTVIAGLISDDVVTLMLSSVLTFVSSVCCMAVVWSVQVPRSSGGMVKAKALIRGVRMLPPLRRTVTIDLLFAAVLPTQLIALIVSDTGTSELLTIALTASLAGVLAGRMLLVATGLNGDLARRLRWAYLTYAALAIACTPLLVNGWLLESTALVASSLFIGSALLAYSQNLPVALLQQQVPDEFRGSLSGAMNALRNVLIAVTALGFTAVALVFNAVFIAAALAVLLLIGFIVARGFTGFGLALASPPPTTQEL